MSKERPLRKYFGKNDIILLSIIAILVVVLFIIQIGFSLNKSSTISILVDGSNYGEYSLEEDQVIPIMIEGKKVNEVTISDGAAHMSYATCPDHLCMKQGKIDSMSQSIVCLPNRVIVTVTDGKDSEIDSMSN